MNIKNNITLIGRIVADLEIQVKENFTFLRFTVAIDDSYFDKNQNKKIERSQFINCVAKNSTAEHISKFYAKGDQIAINGKLISRRYKNPDDSETFFTEVEIETADILLRVQKKD